MHVNAHGSISTDAKDAPGYVDGETSVMKEAEEETEETNFEEPEPRSRQMEVKKQVSFRETADEVSKREALEEPSPLTWEEARATLRNVLETYMDSPLPVTKSNAGDESRTRWQWWFHWDMDVYAGALPLSAALLALTTTSLVARQNEQVGSRLNAAADISVYRAQVAASVLVFCGTLLSIILMKRRQHISTRDSDVAKRTSIMGFLRASDKKEETCSEETGIVRESERSKVESEHKRHEGTSRTDIYPAFRHSQRSALWHNVPTLLLVKGDFIALQVGDVAPAKCRWVDFGTSGRRMSTRELIVEAGERISVETFGNAKSSPVTAFPRGKSTVPPQSRQLLTLCNEMSVFVLEETPLEAFLSLPHAKQRLPQVHRQLRELRQVLYLFALGVFATTFLVIFVRPGITSTDLSIVLHVPFLAAIAVLPVASPLTLFFLEAIGTARILVKVHPHVKLQDAVNRRRSWLFLQYVLAVAASRLSLQDLWRKIRNCLCSVLSLRHVSNSDGDGQSHGFGMILSGLVRVPPASTFLLEKLGVATAFTLVDDELVCEPYSIPQQLLIPSGNGLKLLNLCPTYDTDSEDDSEEEGLRKRRRSYGSSQDGSESDSDDDHRLESTSAPKRKLRSIRKRKRKKKIQQDIPPNSTCDLTDDNEVQFEDPVWWHYLPSLKCIGLACMLVDDKCDTPAASHRMLPIDEAVSQEEGKGQATQELMVEPLLSEPPHVKKALIHHVCGERERLQLRLLARCIGFSTERNSFGERGDLTFFKEKLRVNVVSTNLLGERLASDAHAIGLEESRGWGQLRPDSSSVIVQDMRSKAHQLLTVGDPRVVTGLCHEAWQGENSTISPLNTVDRGNILDTSTNWTLSDLDVSAFAYSPVPSSLESRFSEESQQTPGCSKMVYMVENSSNAPSKDAVSEDWAIINKQIFLGVLGSSVIPRKEIEKLLETFDEAGVRFVYFSPRNMRRTKELASQIGIDVAWNCAISLRSLDEGEEDPHRMVSTYADWSINAKLPHGVENVRKHLEEVDNVPLLVSLFTDSTKESSQEMIKTFQEYNDTVVAMGLSHLPRNASIFSAADISIGADVLAEELSAAPVPEKSHTPRDSLLPHEVEFVWAISAHSCAFTLHGAASSSLMPDIIAQGRAALEAATAAAHFILYASICFALFALFSMCAVSTILPFVPTMGSFLFLQLVLPILSLGLAMSDSDEESMKRVPPKNDQSITFSRKEGARLYQNTLLKGLLPSVLTQILHLIALGELMIRLEPIFLQEECAIAPEDIDTISWVSVIRCQSLKTYSGEARTSAGFIVLADLVVCVIISSASFVHATVSVRRVPPWSTNLTWALTSLVSIALVAVYLIVALDGRTFYALPWYFYFLAAIVPFLCLAGNELIKRSECRHIERAAKLRRLQFETRLGMWSPK